MKLFLIIISSAFIFGCGNSTCFDDARREGRITFYNWSWWGECHGWGAFYPRKLTSGGSCWAEWHYPYKN